MGYLLNHELSGADEVTELIEPNDAGEDTELIEPNDAGEDTELIELTYLLMGEDKKNLKEKYAKYQIKKILEAKSAASVKDRKLFLSFPPYALVFTLALQGWQR